MDKQSGFFYSINGDRKYNSEDMTKLLSSIFTDGILSTKENLFSITTDYKTAFFVDKGFAWFDNTWIENDSPLRVPFEIEPYGGIRWVSLYLEIDKESRTASFVSYIGPRPNVSTYGVQFAEAVIMPGEDKASDFSPRNAYEIPLITSLVENLKFAPEVILEWESKARAYIERVQYLLEEGQQYSRLKSDLLDLRSDWMYKKVQEWMGMKIEPYETEDDHLVYSVVSPRYSSGVFGPCRCDVPYNESYVGRIVYFYVYSGDVLPLYMDNNLLVTHEMLTEGQYYYISRYETHFTIRRADATKDIVKSIVDSSRLPISGRLMSPPLTQYTIIDSAHGYIDKDRRMIYYPRIDFGGTTQFKTNVRVYNGDDKVSGKYTNTQLYFEFQGGGFIIDTSRCLSLSLMMNSGGGYTNLIMIGTYQGEYRVGGVRIQTDDFIEAIQWSRPIEITNSIQSRTLTYTPLKPPSPIFSNFWYPDRNYETTVTDRFVICGTDVTNKRIVLDFLDLAYMYGPSYYISDNTITNVNDYTIAYSIFSTQLLFITGTYRTKYMLAHSNSGLIQPPTISGYSIDTSFKPVIFTPIPEEESPYAQSIFPLDRPILWYRYRKTISPYDYKMVAIYGNDSGVMQYADVGTFSYAMEPLTHRYVSDEYVHEVYFVYRHSSQGFVESVVWYSGIPGPSEEIKVYINTTPLLTPDVLIDPKRVPYLYAKIGNKYGLMDVVNSRGGIVSIIDDDLSTINTLSTDIDKTVMYKSNQPASFAVIPYFNKKGVI